MKNTATGEYNAQENNANAIQAYAKPYAIYRTTRNYLEPGDTFARMFKTYNLPELARDGIAIDFGCGDGRHCLYLSKFGFRVIGTDVSQEAVDLTNDRKDEMTEGSEGRLVSSFKDLENLPSPVSLVLAWEVLHWLGHENIFSRHMDIFVEKLKGSAGRKSALVFTLPTEDHFLLANAQRQEGHTQLVLSVRKNCLIFAPPLQWIRNELAKYSPSQVYIHRYEYGNENSTNGTSLENRFSMYAFCAIFENPGT